MSFHPQYVTDESMNPVAVLIPYAEWIKITKKLGLKAPGETPSKARQKSSQFLEDVDNPSPSVRQMAADARKAHREGKTRKFPG